MPLRHTLLGLLDRTPMHGYRLRQHARRFSWIYPMTNASIYPALHSLEQERFVTHHSEVRNGRVRKVYEITESGRRELRTWLAKSLTTASSLHDPMLLQVALQREESVEIARHWLEAAIAELDEQIEHHRLEMQQNVETSDYARLAMEYRADVLGLRRRLLESVLARAAEVPSVSILSA